MPPVISKGEKKLCYIIIIAIDAIQIIFDFFIITEPLNHFIDIGVAILLAIYAIQRKLFTGQKIMVLAATFLAEQVPFVNALPFWTYDLHNLYKDSIEEEPPAIDTKILPRYQNGVGLPRNSSSPLNQGGKRAPRKNVIE